MGLGDVQIYEKKKIRNWVVGSEVLDFRSMQSWYSRRRNKRENCLRGEDKQTYYESNDRVTAPLVADS